MAKSKLERGRMFNCQKKATSTRSVDMDQHRIYTDQEVAERTSRTLILYRVLLSSSLYLSFLESYFHRGQHCSDVPWHIVDLLPLV